MPSTMLLSLDEPAHRRHVTERGESGIRTHEPREGPSVFKTDAFNRSAISPCKEPLSGEGFTPFGDARSSSRKPYLRSAGECPSARQLNYSGRLQTVPPSH